MLCTASRCRPVSYCFLILAGVTHCIAACSCLADTTGVLCLYYTADVTQVSVVPDIVLDLRAMHVLLTFTWHSLAMCMTWHLIVRHIVAIPQLT